MTDRVRLFAAAAAALVFAACSGESSDTSATEEASSQDAAAEPARTVSWPHEDSDVPADERIRYGVLDNGMRYAIMPNDTPSGTAALRLVLNVGSLAEAEDQRGLAHFIEHMTFNGTTNVPEGEMIPLLERYGLAFGPDTNAFTGQEVVGYQLDLPSTEEQVLKTGLFLMRETASEIVFDPDAIDRERGVIRGEMRFRDTPIQRYFLSYQDFLYPDTIIADRSPIGTVEVLDNAPAERFQAYYEDYYVPERATLVVVGDIDPDQVEAMIRDGFGIELPGLEVSEVEGFSTWVQPEDAAGDPDVGDVGEVTDSRFGYFTDPEIFTLINIDVVEPGRTERDTVAQRRADLMRTLGNSIVQRRLQSAINSGSAPMAQASLSHTNDYELADRAGAFAVSSPERWREGLQLLEQEIRRAIEHGFSEAELAEQIANVRTGLRTAAQSADTRRSTELADAIWSSWLGGQVFSSPESALERFESYEDDLTVEAVEEAFREMWTAAPPLVHVAVNEQIEDGAAEIRRVWEESVEIAVDPVEDAGESEFAYTDFGAPGEVAETEQVDDLDFTRHVFENGVRLNIKRTDFENDRIRLRVDFGAGDLTDQPTPAAGTILGAAFGGGGLEAHDRDELQRLFAGRSVGYGLGVGSDSFYFSNTTTPEDFDLQMQVLAAFMVAPGWREDGLNQFRAIAEELRRGQNSQAVQVATQRVIRDVHGGDPRWGFPTEQELSDFTMDHAREMLEPALGNAPVEITIVGDVDPDRAVELTAATFGALPERDADWPDFDENRQVEMAAANDEPEIVTFSGQPDQGMANLYWPTDDAFDARRGRALSLLGGVYRLKATDRFREQEGATYSPIVSASSSDVFEDLGYLWVGLDVDYDDVPRMYGIAREIAAEMAEGGISEDDLLRARQPVMERLSQNREDNGWWTSSLARNQLEPDTLDRLRSLESDYESLEADELISLAAEHLQPDAAYQVSILPASRVQDGEPEAVEDAESE